MAISWIEPIAGLAAYAFATSITPGPNNVILAASGANHGVRRTVPNLLGVSIGFSSLLILVGFGGEALLSLLPGLDTTLRVIGVAYMLYLAWRIAGAGRAGEGRHGRPLSLMEAIAFQFLNPKAWAMAISAHAAFRIPELEGMEGILVVTLTVALVNLPCLCVWAGFGRTMGDLLKTDRALRIFNLTLGLVTAASALLLL